MLELTDAGQIALRYAEQIFGLGAELAEALSGRLPTGKIRLRVGIVDAVPKLVVHRLLRPILQLDAPVMLDCSEGMMGVLLDRLVSHELDLVISETLAPPRALHRVYNHLLHECSTSFFATESAVQVTDSRPLLTLLQEVPLLLPSHGTALRRQLERYFDSMKIEPHIAHEFTDSALMKVFGEEGIGIFPAAAIVEEKVCQQYAVRCLGTINDVREQFYAITAERQIDHPAVASLIGKSKSPVISRKTE
jgi:LysR family transcriptional activator of nhaA